MQIIPLILVTVTDYFLSLNILCLQKKSQTAAKHNVVGGG